MPGVSMGRNRPELGHSRYRRRRAAVLAEDDTCHLCGHPGADVIDHVNPRLPRDDEDNWRPAHGIHRCPTCGRNCNGAKGAKPLSEVRLPTSIDWYS